MFAERKVQNDSTVNYGCLTRSLLAQLPSSPPIDKNSSEKFAQTNSAYLSNVTFTKTNFNRST